MDVPVIGPGAGVPQLVPHVEVPVAEPDTEAPQLVPHVEVPVAGPGTKVQQLVPHLEVPEVGPGMDVPIDEPRMEMPIIERRAEVSTAKLRKNMADADRRTNGSIELEIEGTVESVGYPVTRLPIGDVEFRRIGAVLGDDPGDAVGDAEEMPMERWDRERPDTQTDAVIDENDALLALFFAPTGKKARKWDVFYGLWPNYGDGGFFEPNYRADEWRAWHTLHGGFRFLAPVSAPWRAPPRTVLTHRQCHRVPNESTFLPRSNRDFQDCLRDQDYP
ncbi:hypothetical protein GE061_009715 [Apolygus lucorum]|uniref:Uncharacterized protein n=1 Tax=Apolygus lucorum TaxID=248454 RepID=A0A8S9Y104_APOLU|nr:hypothetical protein GE061_009715 [Apolygus lucorum]